MHVADARFSAGSLIFGSPSDYVVMMFVPGGAR